MTDNTKTGAVPELEADALDLKALDLLGGKVVAALVEHDCSCVEINRHSPYGMTRTVNLVDDL